MEEMMNTEPEGIDGVIAKVDSYLANPKMVTPETLMSLKEDLMDIKMLLDGEEEMEEEPTAMSEMVAKYGGMK